jgi:endogenous inhibitor of DNA gyrase (YacG/DUF329 family)
MVRMAPEARCVYCRERPVDPAWRPFCSERCRLADLWKWLHGDYRIPGEPVPREPEEEPPPEGGPNR